MEHISGSKYVCVTECLLKCDWAELHFTWISSNSVRSQKRFIPAIKWLSYYWLTDIASKFTTTKLKNSWMNLKLKFSKREQNSLLFHFHFIENFIPSCQIINWFIIFFNFPIDSNIDEQTLNAIFMCTWTPYSRPIFYRHVHLAVCK